MTVLNFIDLLNILINPSKEESINMQIIPAYNFEKIPPVPFATYDIYDSSSDFAKEDFKDILENKIIEYTTEREEVMMRFKVYSTSHEEAYNEFKKLLYNILFVWRNKIIKSHVFIINHKEEGQRIEKLEEGYIYAYSFSLTIALNNTISREVRTLETISVNLNDKYNIEEKFYKEKK